MNGSFILCTPLRATSRVPLRAAFANSRHVCPYRTVVTSLNASSRNISTSSSSVPPQSKSLHTRRSKFPFKTVTAALFATGLSYLIYRDHQDSPNSARIATQNVRFKRSIPQAANADSEPSIPNDPLSILDPDELASSTAHLVELPLSQLIRAYMVFLASSSPTLVDIAPPTIEKIEWLKEKVPFIGKPLWSMLVFVGHFMYRDWLFKLANTDKIQQGMRQTFFAQFVAGETAEGSFPLLERLHARGCSAMLNWSAEADHAIASKSSGHEDRDPGILKESFDELHRAVKAAIDFHPEYPLRPTMLAIKMTGLVRDPGVFERFTEAIHSGLKVPSTHLLPDSRSSDDLVKGPTALLSQSDITTLLAVYSNLSSLLRKASANGVRIAFDAEQSWYQPALSRIVSLLAKEFNSVAEDGGRDGTARAPIVYNTYQANLKETESVIRADLQSAREEGYSLGFKLVRGAYVTAENARAAKSGKASKVWPNKAATDACFDACSELILQEVVDSLQASSSSFNGDCHRVCPSIVYATHNASSIKRSLEQMREKGLISDEGRTLKVDPRVRGRVSYAQLLGMTDNLTTAMFQLFPHTPCSPGQPPLLPITALYIPYGQIDRVLPYLVRRAQENKAILQGSDGSGRGGAAEQRRAIGKEVRRRLFPFF